MRILILLLIISFLPKVSWSLDSGQELEILRAAEDISLDKDELTNINFHVLFNKQDDGFKELIFNTWKNLQETKRVKRLTPELREKLSLPKLHCLTPTNCNELVAVYLPLSHYILVDYEKINIDTAVWFFHELVHAVQYTYRLPLDLDLLYQRVPADKLFDYLRFYYEAQANWYTLRLDRNKAWEKAQQGAVSSGFETAAKITLGLATFTVLPNISKAQFTKLLPDIDHFRGTSVERKAFELHELPVIKQYHMFNPGIHLDLGLFKKFVKAIERGYFGGLEFLYQKDNGDQIIYRDMHNQFYATFGDRTPSILGICNSVFKTVQEGSPLLTWMTADERDLNCLIYKDLSFFQKRQEMLRLFEDEISSQFFHAGTKGGGGPGLKLSPLIQPQLLILPEK